MQLRILLQKSTINRAAAFFAQTYTYSYSANCNFYIEKLRDLGSFLTLMLIVWVISFHIF